MNIALPVILFFLLGIFLYYIDLKVGVRLYRSWYKLTHKDPLPDHIKRGFIVNASLESRFIIAVIFVIAEVLLSLKMGNSPPILDVLLGVIGFIGLMLGFYLGGNLMRGMAKTAGFIEGIDKGEIDLKSEIHKGISTAGEMITAKKTKTTETNDSDSHENKLEDSEEKDKPDKNWRDGVDEFLKK